MAGYYTVKEGDHISGIAQRAGFADYNTLWNHPNNADLKALRQNPNVLFPGDSVYVPDLEKRTEDRPTDQRHKFQLNTKPLELRLVLERFYSAPFANDTCLLRVDTTQSELTSDDTGKIEEPISKTAVAGTLTVKDTITYQDKTIPVDRLINLKIGFLDPVTEVSGQRTRLANLGYYRSSSDALDQDEFRSAMEEFQCENGLVVDGICGPQTQAKLLSVHGC